MASQRQAARICGLLKALGYWPYLTGTYAVDPHRRVDRRLDRMSKKDADRWLNILRAQMAEPTTRYMLVSPPRYSSYLDSEALMP